MQSFRTSLRWCIIEFECAKYARHLRGKTIRATTAIRSIAHDYVPGHIQNPVSLVLRILASRNPEAIYALFSAGAQAALTPLDLALGVWENRIYERSAPPQRPIVFVVGPPRSGTTLVAQALIASLPVAYFNNLTSVFPRSPILVNRAASRPFRNERIEFRSFYGKSKKWFGPNDALYFWDRWLGRDRTVIPASVDEPNRTRLIQFFGAFQEAFPRPLVAKHNNMNAYANVVAPLLPTSIFLCLRRDPLYLAQALLKSRRDIHGSDDASYGLDDPAQKGRKDNNPYEAVCRQVAFYQTLEREQLEALGPDRYWIVDYEAFCNDPNAIVGRVAKYISRDPICETSVVADLKPFSASRRQNLSDEEFGLLTQELKKRSLIGDSD